MWSATGTCYVGAHARYMAHDHSAFWTVMQRIANVIQKFWWSLNLAHLFCKQVNTINNFKIKCMYVRASWQWLLAGRRNLFRDQCRRQFTSIFCGFLQRTLDLGMFLLFDVRFCPPTRHNRYRLSREIGTLWQRIWKLDCIESLPSLHHIAKSSHVSCWPRNLQTYRLSYTHKGWVRAYWYLLIR